MQIVKVPQLAWYGPKYLELTLPDNWDVQICFMEGYKRPVLQPEQILAALRNPIGTPPLRELARNKKEVAIVFDDLTRVTRTAKIVPLVIEELEAAGITDENIRFICGLGLHGVMYRSDFVKKLGEEIVTRFKVFNHNAFGNCIYAGTTDTLKTPVYINEEYLKCDLKILIGACVPHPLAGFGGGGKLILPGITSFDTTKWHHSAGGLVPGPVDGQNKPTIGPGFIDDNLFKKDIDEAASLAGIDFLINPLVNLWGESVSIYAGDWKLAFAEAIKEANTHYRTPKASDKDIVISNSYAKASECLISLQVAMPLVSPLGGDIVVIANAPEGQVSHYLLGIFGKTTCACRHVQPKFPAYINRVIAFNEYPHRGSSWFEEDEKITYLSKWDQVLKHLQTMHPKDARVAVIPDATNQFFAWFD